MTTLGRAKRGVAVEKGRGSAEMGQEGKEPGPAKRTARRLVRTHQEALPAGENVSELDREVSASYLCNCAALPCLGPDFQALLCVPVIPVCTHAPLMVMLPFIRNAASGTHGQERCSSG